MEYLCIHERMPVRVIWKSRSEEFPLASPTTIFFSILRNRISHKCAAKKTRYENIGKGGVQETILGGFGGHQVGHTRLLLLPLTNIVPPLLKQQDPALALSPPPPWWCWCWRLDSLQKNCLFELFVCLFALTWMESGEEGKAARLPPPRPSQGPSRGWSHPSRSFYQLLHLVIFTSAISFENPFFLLRLRSKKSRWEELRLRVVAVESSLQLPVDLLSNFLTRFTLNFQTF